MNTFEKIRNQAAKIPEGKVSTYGDVAKAVDLRDVRKVGWALHQNKDTESCPCHRVVNKDGRVAPGYAFGGPNEQRRRLEEEGVGFIDKECVDLEKYRWNNF
ncbi:MAG: methylated-DNA--[protein]-cysteine S-methyltransferase [Patescibacteria group bacterium]